MSTTNSDVALWNANLSDLAPHGVISVVSPATGVLAPFATEVDVRHIPLGVWFGCSGKEPFVGHVAMVKLMVLHGMRACIFRLVEDT